MNIVILDAFTANPGDLSWAELERLGSVTVYDRTAAADTVTRCLDADIVLTNKVCLGRQEVERLPRLKYIGVLATGYNVVDIAAASQRGIVVTNVPAYSTDSVAQMVFAHLLTVTNRAEHYARQVRQGRWSASTDFCFWDSPLTELSGKTFGIVGLGHIGQQVARIAQGFGMHVVASTSKSACQLPPGVGKAALGELFSLSDVLSLHCPLTVDIGCPALCLRDLQAEDPGRVHGDPARDPVCRTAVAHLVNVEVSHGLGAKRLCHGGICIHGLADDFDRVKCIGPRRRQ